MTHQLYDNLKKYRKANKMTQLDVANHLRIQRSTYSRYEEGTNRPNFCTLIALADLYHIRLDELVGRPYGTEQEPDDIRMLQDLFLTASDFAKKTALFVLKEGQGKEEKRN